jgi:hypothetical protein
MTVRIGPFKPSSPSSTIAVTNASQRVAFTGGNNVDSIYLANVGTKECFVEFGGPTVAATAGGNATNASDGSMSIPAGFYGVISNVGQSNIRRLCCAAAEEIGEAANELRRSACARAARRAHL